MIITLSLAFAVLALEPAAAARPWDPPSGCWGSGDEWLELYEVVDATDATVNLRDAVDNERILAAVPVRSVVVLAQPGPLTTWSEVWAEEPDVVTRAWVEKRFLEKWASGLVVSGTKQNVPVVPLLDRADAKAAVVREVSFATASVVVEAGAYARVIATEPPRELQGVMHKSRLKKLKTREPSPSCTSEVTP